MTERTHRLSRGWDQQSQRMVRTYVLPVIGQYKLRSVTPPQVGDVLAKMSVNGRSAQTRRHVYNLLRQMFSDAVEYYGYLDKSPVMKKDAPKVHRTERRFLVPEDSWKLLNRSVDHYLAPAVWVGFLTGLRTSEIQALRWESVDFGKEQILIKEAFKRSIGEIEPYPKNKDWSYVAMPRALVDFLRPRAKGQHPKAFVCPAFQGGMLEQKKLHNGLQELCKRAGVDVISPHEMRHSCTEIWIAMGASTEDLRRQLNQKSSETTQRYIHRTDDRLQSIAQKIGVPTAQLKLVNQ